MHRKVAALVWFCKVAGENAKIERNFCPKFLKVVKKAKKNLPHLYVHNIEAFYESTPPPQVIFMSKQREENNIARNRSRSDILLLLTLLSADAKSVAFLRVLPLTKLKYEISRCYIFLGGSV